MFEDLIGFIRKWYDTNEAIALHAPIFSPRDRELVLDAINSTFVSSIGQYVDRFEQDLADFTGAERAIATVNGTTTLQVALRLVGVEQGDEVITQPLTFVATANAIVHAGGVPAFVDVDIDTLGMDPKALYSFLDQNTCKRDGGIYNTKTGRRIAAVVPMHTFGHPCRMEEIIDVAGQRQIPVVEDAAEALGSWRGERHCGTFGRLGILSFNGNKIITCGGGGAILTNDGTLADKAKHLITTAKLPHDWEFQHDEVGYNFRLPNLNAALACAQLEKLPDILDEKRKLARAYEDFFASTPWGNFILEPPGCRSNYWLCSITVSNPDYLDALLRTAHTAGIFARPAWRLMPELPMYAGCQCGPLKNAWWLRKRIVSLPSGMKRYS